MKNKAFLLWGAAAAAAFFVSCATTIPVTVSHSPKMDTNGIERMVVLPFTGQGSRQQIAGELTGIFKDKIGGTGTFQILLVDAGAVDAVFTGEVTKYMVKDSSRQVEREKEDGRIVKVTVYDREVELDFTSRMVRERDGTVIGERRISCTGTDSGKDKRADLEPGFDLGREAAQHTLKDFHTEIVPWTSTEDLTLDVDVVIREITPSLMNRNIQVLERGENAALLDTEKQFQASGEVGDDSYVSLGHMLGVETIVTFSITGSSHQRKLTVRSVSVETGKVLYNESTDM